MSAQASNIYPYGNGYTCSTCGQWVLYGSYHSCTGGAGSFIQTWPTFDFGQHYRQALEEIVNLLGPDTAGCDENECEGCRYEMAEALETALVALGRKERAPTPPPHRRKADGGA